MNLLSCVFIALCLLRCTYSQTYENISNLHDTLFLSYNKDIRPLNNQTDVISINMTVFLFGIPEVDQVRGSVSYIVQIVSEWFDERMTWTPADYGGISDILVASDEVWTPSLTIGNPIEFTKVGHTWMQVTLYPDGHAVYLPSDVVEASCSFNLKYWPFDKQLCQLSVFPFGYSINKLTLNVPGEIVDTKFYTDNGEWTLDKDTITYAIDNSFGVTVVRYYLRLTRQSTFYLLTIIMPINAIGALTCLVFLLPSASGERVSYSITILLALAVFMTVIAEDLPKTSEPVPILCVWIIFEIAVSVAGLILVILNLMLYHRDDRIPISSWYLSVVRLSRYNSCCKKSDETLIETISLNIPDNKEQRRNTIASKPIAVKQDNNDTSTKVEIKDNISFDDDNGELTWKDVSVAMDKIVIIVMLVTAYIPSIVILIYMATATDFVEPSTW